jgi:hypothetical protein
MAKYLVFGIVFFCLVTVMHAWGVREGETVVEITGIVRLVGSSPATELVISGLDKEWYIAKEEEHKLKNLQHRTVTVKGSETVINLTFANGFPAGERRTLRKIKIIAAE